MKLYIWNNPYKVQYGTSFAYAIAPDVDTARQAIRDGHLAKYGSVGDDKVKDFCPENLDIDRAPDRILDGPAGEIYEWEE